MQERREGVNFAFVIVVVEMGMVKIASAGAERHVMDKRILDYETAGKRSTSGRFEFVSLLSLTLAPLLVVFDVVGPPFERLAGTVFWSVWVGMGSVLPWRYVRRGKHPVWAGILAVICMLFLAWVLVLEGYGLIQRFTAP